jgi:[amino group carrier protein]-L-2-aminoadipate 6-kinase
MTIVVKIGGAEGNDLDPVLAELARRTDVVLVHGGSAEIDRLGLALGRPSEYYTSPSGVVSRRSDAAHLEVVLLALAGKVQTGLVANLGRRGVSAVGLSGVDGSLLLARRKDGARAVVNGRVVRLADDRSGTVEHVNARLLRLLLDAGMVPVVGPPAVTAAGEIVNVDADRVAAQVAIALGAESLVFLTNVPGLLRNKDDQSTRIARVGRAELPDILPLAAGRMRKKILAAREALEGGVPRVAVASSSGPDPIERGLRGEGTILQ